MSQCAGLHGASRCVFCDSGASGSGVVCVESEGDAEEGEDHAQTASQDKTTTT